MLTWDPNRAISNLCCPKPLIPHLDKDITHGQNRQGCCSRCSQWSCWSHTQPQSDLGTLASCRNTSDPRAGSSSTWQVRSTVHTWELQRWPALWQRGPAPGETGFLELSLNCERINIVNIFNVWNFFFGQKSFRWKRMNIKLTISSPSHLCFPPWGRARSLCLPLCQNAFYKMTAKTYQKRINKTSCEAHNDQQSLAGINTVSSGSTKYLIFKAFIYTESLRAKAVLDSKVAHEVGQVNGPHALRELQLPACSLKLLITDCVEVPAGFKTHHTE